MKKIHLRRMVYASVFLALGIVLPFLTAQIKEIGDSLLPMHLPVMLCGLLCGPAYGAAVGFILPFLRALTFGMPPLYPNAVWMACELATYGLVIGWMYARGTRRGEGYLYACLACSMLSGRIVWGIAKAVLLGIGGKPFPMLAFLTGGFLDAIPGIVLQFVLIPLIMRLVKQHRKNQPTA